LTELAPLTRLNPRLTRVNLPVLKLHSRSRLTVILLNSRWCAYLTLTLVDRNWAASYWALAASIIVPSAGRPANATVPVGVSAPVLKTVDNAVFNESTNASKADFWALPRTAASVAVAPESTPKWHVDDVIATLGPDWNPSSIAEVAYSLGAFAGECMPGRTKQSWYACVRGSFGTSLPANH